jgi:hypothetical protein
VSGVAVGRQVHRVRNVAFEDVHVTMRGGMNGVPADPPEYVGQYPDPNLWGEVPSYGVFLRHADGVTFTRTTIDVDRPDARNALDAVDVANLVPPSP